MENLAVTAAAKQACNALVYIAERTDKEGVPDACKKAIECLCSAFSITVFGSLPDNSSSSVPGVKG